MKHLWQRIFVYTLVLIAISQGAALLLHRYSLNSEEARRFIRQSATELSSALDGQSLETASVMAGLFSKRSTRAWVEDKDGTLLAGELPREWHPEGLSDTVGHWSYDGLDIWETDKSGGRYVVFMPIRLHEADVVLKMSFSPPRRPAFWGMFLSGLMVLSGIGVVLALWMAWRVSRPLRRVRNGVMEIAAGNLDRRIEVSGRDEIADLAVSVNHMADSLSRTIRSMRELVANVSHELRSPLARMQVSLALLEESLPTEGVAAERAASKAALLHEELNHMEALIGATLLTSKLDLQDHPPMTEAVAFSDLCAEMCRRHEPLMARGKLTFVAAIEPGVVFPGDETLLCNLVSNLLDNAAKYASENGRVDVRLRRDGANALLEVENTHSPLPEDMLERIFEPFNRANLATGNGVGLGLSLVRKIAALHRAETFAANTEGGVVFVARFPLDG